MAWTIEALKEYVDQRFVSTDRAIDKASTALDERLGGMNQFRAQISEERASLVTKDVYDQHHAALEARVDTIISRLEPRVATLERWQAKIIGALAFVLFLTPIVTAVVVWVITNHRAP